MISNLFKITSHYGLPKWVLEFSNLSAFYKRQDRHTENPQWREIFNRGINILSRVITVYLAIIINHTGLPFTHNIQADMLITGHLFSKTMSLYLWSAFLAEEQQSCWTHALVCLYNSRQLQSYWLVLCWDHSNNQAVSRQKALDWASGTAEEYLSHILPILLCFAGFGLLSDNNGDILVLKGCLTLSFITLKFWEVNHT